MTKLPWMKYLPVVLFQILLIVLFAVFVRYDTNNVGKEKKTLSASMYTMFQNVQVMIFIGFGFLMTFLKRYGFSSLGFTWIVAVLVIQWALLCVSFYHMDGGVIRITLESLLEADISSATVLISMGVVLGRTTVIQLLVMGIIEIAVYAANLFIIIDLFKVSDAGDSVTVHTFGAYFGLAVSMMMRTKKNKPIDDPVSLPVIKNLGASSYNSDITAMIGSLFLWICWPSFNAGSLEDYDEQLRAITNTYLSLCAATFTAFIISSIVTHDMKFDMVHVQNATLAGGVAVGSVCNMSLQPFGALLVGTAAGLLSVIGYKYLTPHLDAHFGLKDTCGVNNLHGMPGILSGLLSAVLAATACDSQNYSIFPAMAPESAENEHSYAVDGYGRSAASQACFQLLGLGITIIISSIAGGITGRLLTTKLFEHIPPERQYDDVHSWELPEEDQVIPVETTKPDDTKRGFYYINDGHHTLDDLEVMQF